MIISPAVQTSCSSVKDDKDKDKYKDNVNAITMIISPAVQTNCSSVKDDKDKDKHKDNVNASQPQ